MNIVYDEEYKSFHLYNEKISYVMKIEKNCYLSHCYFGREFADGTKLRKCTIMTGDFVQTRTRQIGRSLWIRCRGNIQILVREIFEVRQWS